MCCRGYTSFRSAGPFPARDLRLERLLGHIWVDLALTHGLGSILLTLSLRLYSASLELCTLLLSACRVGITFEDKRLRWLHRYIKSGILRREIL